MKFIRNSLLLFGVLITQATVAQHKIAKEILAIKDQHREQKAVNLFVVDNSEDQSKYTEILSEAVFLKYNFEKASELILSHSDFLLLIIPGFGTNEFHLELKQANFLTPDFSIVSSSGIVLDKAEENSVHYQGIISGDSLSVCAISIFKNEVMGMISSPTIGNIVIGKLKDNKSGTHILYNDQNLLVPPPINCQTPDDNEYYQAEQLLPPRINNVNCIRLYWEINFDIYSGQGGLTNTTNYALGIFNQSAILYSNDGIPVQLSQLYIWDTTSPYTSGSSSGLLSQFQSTRTSFAGDLGHLLGYAGSGGIAASVSGICASNVRYSQCYSGVSPFYQNVPVYSWTITVVTHEQGHLMGSRHTHGCVWNGNNTAIDDCGPRAGYPYEGSCSGAPTPTSGGTIMSYCHLTSTGINFSNGFGPQPTTVILNNYNNGTCLTACTGGIFCGACSDLQSSNATTTSITLSWTPAINANSYIIQYRESGTTTWITDTTSNTIYQLNGLQNGTSYEWQVQTVCSGSTSVFTSSGFFITVPLVCNIPNNITVNTVTSVSAVITWQAVNASIRYIIRYKPVVSATWLTDSTTNTYITLRHLQSSTAYEFQVQTVCAGEGTSGYSSSIMFSTSDAGSPETVTIQPDANCGKDAFIASQPTNGINISNYGDHQEINVMSWTVSSLQAQQRTLLDFDLSFIPQGSGIQSATLSLFWNPTSSNTGHSTLSGSNSSILQKITQPWDEHLVTWVNQPPTTIVNEVTLPASTSTTQDYNSIDITDIIQDFVNDPASNYGIMIQLLNETPYRSLTFCSSDHPNPALRPKLELTYLPNQEPCKYYQYSFCNGIDALLGRSPVAGYDTINFGNNTEMNAISWTNGGQQSDTRSLMYWNFSDIPSNAVITQANLNLYWNPNSSNTGHSSQSGSNEAVLIRASSAWDEQTVTWNTQPTLDTNYKTLLPPSANSQQDYIIDVRSLVQKMVSDPPANYGMMLKLTNETYFRSLTFCSSDHVDPARRPRIEVCYMIPTNIQENISTIEFSISQNPELNLITVYRTIDFEKGTTLYLYDLGGKLLRQFQDLNRSQFNFSSTNLDAGLYFISLKSGSNNHTKKLVLLK